MSQHSSRLSGTEQTPIDDGFLLFQGAEEEATMARRWSDEEISKLKEMAGQFRAKKIAGELHRGVGATIVRAHRQGISLRPPKRETLPEVDPSPAGLDLSR
jgi:hypothetical protein